MTDSNIFKLNKLKKSGHGKKSFGDARAGC